MAPRRQVYELTFSTQRLQAILEDAGFALDVPPRLVGRMVRLVSCPSEETIVLEVQDTPGDWRAPDPRPIETAAPGHYL